MNNPTTFFIELTNKCNLCCKHCYAYKNDLTMSKQTLNLVNDYIAKQIKATNEHEYVINYVGGEIGLLDQKEILKSILFFKETCKNKQLRFIYQSNLVYTFTDEHLSILNLVDEVGTSYDFEIRFKNIKEKMLWLKNIRYIQKISKALRLTITTTRQMLSIQPEILLDYIIALNIHTLEINCMLPSLENKTLDNTLPKTNIVRDWLYKLFIIYEKVKKEYDLEIPNFECLRDSFKGIYHWEHSRTCRQDNLTIGPNGNVSTCLLTQNEPIYNLITKQKLNSKENICNKENTLNDQCKKCKYLNKCKGGCHLYCFDEYGCSVPYKIYDYLEVTNELKGIQYAF